MPWENLLRGPPTHTVWKRRGRSTPSFSSQVLLSPHSLSSCPSGHLVLDRRRSFPRFFPKAEGRATVFLPLTCDLKTSVPVSFLELPALDIRRWVSSTLQSFVILWILGSSGLTATLSKTTAHTVYVVETCSVPELSGGLAFCWGSAAHSLHHRHAPCLSLGQAAPDALTPLI